jgi:predicted DNA-binding transcriptional regulator AlpA
MREYGRRNGAGERSRILTDDEATEALRLLAAGVIVAEVAELMGVHRSVVDRLVAGSYPHLPRPPGIKPIGGRRLRGDDHPARRFDDD